MERWWVEIDRDEVRETINSIVPAGGIAVVLGSVNDGITSAPQIAKQHLNERGYSVLPVNCRGDAGGFRSAVMEIASLAVPNEPGGLRSDLIDLRHLSPDDAADRLSSMASAYFHHTALIVDGVDEAAPLTATEIAALEDFASNTGTPMVFVSERSAADWQAVPLNQISTLRAFTKGEVLDCLIRYGPEKIGTGRLDELQAIANELPADPSGERIIPRDAYAALKRESTK